MSKAAYPLKLPRSVKEAAQRLAREDGVSLNHWISVAVAEKVGAVESVSEVLRKRAGDARPGDLIPYLDRAGDEPPQAGDEVE